MKRYIAISITFFALQSCSEQISKMKKSETNVNGAKIIDPFFELPYKIKNINIPVSLPETLGGKSTHGYVFIELMINNNSQILEASIMKLSLSNQDDGKIVEYNISQGKLPANLKVYENFFEKYCKKKIILKKKHNIRPRAKNLILVRLRVE